MADLSQSILDLAHMSVEQIRHNLADDLLRAVCAGDPKTSMLLFDSNERYVLVAGDVLSVLGWVPEVVEGNTLRGMLDSDEEYAYWHERYQAALGGQQTLEEHADEERDTVYVVQVTPLYALEEHIIGGMVRVIDVTELRQQQNASRLQLKASNKQLQALAYAVSHDLRAPVNALQGFLGLLGKRLTSVADERIHEFLGYAVQATERMDGLLRSLTSLTRIQRQTLLFEAVWPGDLVRVAAESIPALTVQHAIPEALRLTADAALCEQLLIALFNNAVTFVDEARQPTVALSTSEDEAGVTLWIKDNGIGIGEQYFERIFEAFIRLHTPDEYPGPGLGLAECQAIMERHQGRIWLDSSSSEGSLFAVWFPNRGPSTREGS